MPTVFLSYARSDADFAGRLADDLRHQGIETWIDREQLRPGEMWHEQIERAITAADFVLVLISPASLESKWVMAEYQAAFNRMKHTGSSRIIPVLIERATLPPFLASIQYADFTDSYFHGMQQLLRALNTGSGPKPREFLPVTELAEQVAAEVARRLGLEARPPAANQASDPKLVFVIMAFVDDMEPSFEGIKAAAGAVGLVAKRVKDIQGDFKITDQIISMIESSRFVVADLTHERPNVYFELGYARGLKKTVVTIARSNSTIHFDVKDWTFLSYSDSRVLERDLKARFEYELSQ